MDHGAQPLLPEKLFRENWGAAWSGLSQLHPGRSPGHSPAHHGVVPPCPYLTGRADKNTRKEKKNTRKAAQRSNSWADGQVSGQNGWPPEQKSVAPVQPVNLGCRLTRVKTTKPSGLGMLSWWARVGNELTASLVAEDSVQPAWPGSLSQGPAGCGADP